MKRPPDSASSHIGSLVLSILLAFCIFLLAVQSFAAVPDIEDLPKDGKIEVVYPADRLIPYRERRSTWGLTFAVQNEQMYPGSFHSQFDGFGYDKMFGSSPINITQGELGAKYNFSAGSLSAGVVAGEGSVYDTIIRYQYDVATTGPEVRPDIDSELKLTKKGLFFSYMMDALFPEPYVVPYIEGQIIQFDWKENTVGSEGKSGSTEFSTAFTLGALIQLNALDPMSAFEAQKSSGFENLYFDIFVSQ